MGSVGDIENNILREKHYFKYHSSAFDYVALYPALIHLYVMYSPICVTLLYMCIKDKHY